MARQADLDGAAHLMLARGVRHLDEETAVFEAMLEGWKRQQDSRYLRERTIGARLRTVRRFAEFTGQYPWQWGPGEVEAFTSALVSGSKPAAHSTVRNYQGALQMFCASSSPMPGTGGQRNATAGSARPRSRSATSGTPWRTWPNTRGSRDGGR